jgi:hypothetical protein
MSLIVTIVTDLVTEPVTLTEAKEWMQVDYTDFDNLITMLISASRQKSEKMSGLAYGEKTIRVNGNEKGEYIYPVQPFIELDDTYTGTDGNKDYQYTAGLTDLPLDLKVAVLMRVATGFAYRQNGFEEAINMAVNASNTYELAYRQDLYI